MESIRNSALWQRLSAPEFWQSLLESFACLGPAVPILLAMMESFVPVLPLMGIVALNVAAHGPLLGYLYSWAGCALGSVLTFLFWRLIVRRWFAPRIRRSPRLHRAEEWVRGFDPAALFLVAILPFAPASFLNLAFGLSDFKAERYLVTIVLAKLFTVGTLALFGQSLLSARQHPALLVLAALCWGGLYLLTRSTRKKHNL